jgi:hypothetical protein
MPSGKSPADVKAELERVLASELASRKFSYPRTDGSQWTLALKDVMDRAAALEMAYNVNDCVELRWGAPQGSQEAATCKRHAPSEDEPISPLVSRASPPAAGLVDIRSPSSKRAVSAVTMMPAVSRRRSFENAHARFWLLADIL